MELRSLLRRLRQSSCAQTRKCLDKGSRRIARRRSTCPPFGKHTRRAFPFQVPDRHMNQRLKSCAEQRNDKRILTVMCHSFRTKDWWMLILERNKTGCCTNQKLQPDDRDSSIQTVPFLLSPQVFRKGPKEKTVRELDQNNSRSCPLSYLRRKHNRSSEMRDLSNQRNVDSPKWYRM